MPDPTVSVNEVLRLAKRVFLARGAGPGCELEPARATAWLESRGLHGLGTLHADAGARGLRCRGFEESRRDDVPHLQVDGDGVSGAWLAAPVMDWLLAAGPAATVQVTRTRSPLWWLPVAAASAGECRLLAVGPQGAPLLARDGGGALSLCRQAPAAVAGEVVTVHLARGVAGCGWCVPDPALRVTPAQLAARDAQALASGIAVAGRLWCALRAEARGALVPESDMSRARGAGGG